MNRQRHSGIGDIFGVRDVFGGFHVHAPPRHEPDAPPPPGWSAFAWGFVAVVIFALALCGGGIYAVASGATGSHNPGAGGSPSAGAPGAAPTTRPVATYPVRITDDGGWYAFVPQTVFMRAGDSLKFTNETGRTCHLIATTNYLPPGSGRNPVPARGTYVVRFPETAHQTIECEGGVGAMAVAVDR